MVFTACFARSICQEFLLLTSSKPKVLDSRCWWQCNLLALVLVEEPTLTSSVVYVGQSTKEAFHEIEPR